MFFVPFFQEILLLFVLLAASAADIRSRRIPNGLLLAGFFLTALLKLFDGPTGLFISLFAALGLLALASPFFLLRMTGAGDIKTAALVIFACPDQNGILILGYRGPLVPVEALEGKALPTALPPVLPVSSGSRPEAEEAEDRRALPRPHPSALL